jgi:SAM-dependent methyltransferase
VRHNAVAGQSRSSRAQPEDDPLFNPELYDIVMPASFRGDAEWYRSKARHCGGPVLELGAGTGRITLGIAHDGVRVHALDTDPAMLERLTQKLAQQPPEVREHVVRQIVDSQHRYEEYGPDGILTRTSLHRLQLAYLYPPDLLKEAGFQSVQITGGFDGRPFEHDTDELVIEATVDGASARHK